MIYFIRRTDTGRIKIGTTIRLSQRLRQLASEAGCDLEVLAVTGGSFDAEKALHLRFSDLRHAGEWFEPGDDLLGFIVAEARPWDGTDEVPAKHTAMMRVDEETLERTKLAASLMRMSLAEYACEVLRKAADRDIAREAKKLAGGADQ